ncbi:hypothetical protein [Amycolatopsis sp. DSM 110486]|uniref:hypothetical protein n=1 Tax=Amycolatopsis sp. DSM 110486 TaxID=2865832 RepID=UPI001C694B78|nr:hypothetical protein [Amycolatopsis sp. DSM 110486]QYN17499.1 hypothetical protein K1T34_32455 [Amycolatopsis sp. DSM 110486]
MTGHGKELFVAASNCEGGTSSCTNTDVDLVEDPYDADVYNTTVMRWLCPSCVEQIAEAI